MGIFCILNVTYGWLDCYPTPNSKKPEQRDGKRAISRLRHKWAADSCSTVSPPHIDKCLLVYGLHLKLVVSFMLTGLDQNLPSGEISFLPPYIILAQVKQHTVLWDTLLLLLSGLERHISNGEWPLAHQEGEACLFLLADPKTHLVNNPRWCCVIRLHWIRSEVEEMAYLKSKETRLQAAPCCSPGLLAPKHQDWNATGVQVVSQRTSCCYCC